MNRQVTIRLSARAKNTSIVVHQNGKVEVVAPKRHPPSRLFVDRLVQKHSDWIDRQLSRVEKKPPVKQLSHSGIPRQIIERNTLALIEETIVHMRMIHPVEVEKVRLGNFKAQWGSCSHSMTLSFHYKLSLLPRHLAEYVVAHELAHTTHFNHSKAFWSLVDQLCRDAHSCRAQLRRFVLN